MKFVRFIFGIRNILLIGFGLFLIAGGVYNGANLEQGVIPAWYFRAFEPLGYTLIVTTLVAATLNYSFQASIEDRFSIVKGAEGAGIIRFFADRAEALDQVADEAERVNKCIDILCVSGTDLLGRRSKVLEEIGRRFNDKSSVNIRVLMLDPRSRFAIERSLREEGSGRPDDDTASIIYPDSDLCDDTLESLRQLEKVLGV